MRNPFQYGTVVRGEAFCNRKQELKDFRRAMENGEKLFVYSERRLGKTSLVRSALEGLEKPLYVPVYVDLWPTDNEASFVAAVAKAVAEAIASTPRKMLEAARTFFSRLAPSLTVDDEGRPRVMFRLSGADRSDPPLDDVLGAPARIVARGKHRVVVVLDECQRILEYGNDLVERKLRSTIQHHTDVSYFFLGSRKQLVQKMFLDKDRPLYRAAGHYPLLPIGVEHWTPFIWKRFADADKKITEDQIATVCKLTEGHPFYTQHLCYVLWERCDLGAAVTDELIHSALGTLLSRESHAYTTLWESLAMNQRRFLTGLAMEEGPVKPFSSDFTQRYGLGAPSNAQRAAEALTERDVIDRDEGTFFIVDRFFRLWIRKVREEGR